MYDLVIRGATVADGRRHDRSGPTVAVEDGRITKIGTVVADAAGVASAVPSISPRACGV
jgi:N-acyl-D-aspartate/D-glutamate deacylase